MSRNSRGPLAVVRLALSAAPACGAVQAPAAQAAQTTARGQVCMFTYPYSRDALAGHVAWAFQTGPNRWTFGSYSKRPMWKSGWTTSAMISKFRRMGYDGYRCKWTHQRRASAATATWQRLRRTPYRLWTNNCLTVSVAVFRSYSRELRSLPSASGTLPRRYYDRTLPRYGFGKNHRLR